MKTYKTMFARGLLAAAAASALTACGGGGDSSSAATADPIDKYLGSIVFACEDYSSAIQTAATGAGVYVSSKFTYSTKVSATKATGSSAYSYFSTSDCSGTPIYQQTISGTDNYLSVDASATDAGIDVNKVTWGKGARFPGISGSTITINGLVFSSQMFVNRTSVYKDLWHLDAQKKLYVGDENRPLDSLGYPTVLLTKPSATLQ